MKTPQISVVVPVYNAEKYLHRCVDSILGQSYTSFELLLINDGSKDNSAVICDEYVVKDSRVRVFNKENGGVSSARNMGIDNSKGDWITFIDSDDWVEIDYLKCLFENKEDGFVVSAYIYERENNISYEKLNNELITIGPDSLTSILMKGAFTTPYCKLYRREILEKGKIRFNCQLSSYEDTLFVWTYLLHIDKIRTIDNFTYHYCITGSGLSNKRISIDECIFALDCFHKLLLEYQYKHVGFDIRIRLVWLVDQFFKKALKEEVCENTIFVERKTRLCKILQSESVICLLKDKIIMPKGIKRRIFDFLGLNKCYVLLTAYLYFYKYN